MVWEKTAGSGFSTYNECRKSLKSGSAEYNSAQQFLDSGAYQMLEALESSYNCAGYCKTGKYYLTLDIGEGPPT